MKVTVNIDGNAKTFEVEPRDGIETLKTFKLVATDIDDAKIWFVDFASQLQATLNEVTDIIHPPEPVELDPLTAHMLATQDENYVAPPLPYPAELFDTSEQATAGDAMSPADQTPEPEVDFMDDVDPED